MSGCDITNLRKLLLQRKMDVNNVNHCSICRALVPMVTDVSHAHISNRLLMFGSEQVLTHFDGVLSCLPLKPS